MRWRNEGTGRRLTLDLESRPSAHWYDGKTTAEITAFGWKWNDGDVQSLILTHTGRFERQDGKKISTRAAYDLVVGELIEAPLVYGHNIRRFDFPLLNAGLFRLGMPTLPRLQAVQDTLKDLPSTIDFSRSLDTLTSMFDLGKKLGMSISDWERANKLLRDGRESARARVESDVVLHEILRDTLSGLGYLKAPRAWP